MLNSSAVLITETWNHLLVAYDGATLQLSLNGSLCGYATASYLALSGFVDLFPPQFGIMGTLQLYDYTLTSQQTEDLFIAQLVSGVVNSPPSPVVNAANIVTSVRIYPGPHPYTDSFGQLWSPDEDYNVTVLSNSYTPGPLSTYMNNTNDPVLFEYTRVGNYLITLQMVPFLNVSVSVMFADTYFSFDAHYTVDVFANGVHFVQAVDVYAAAGGQNVALVLTLSSLVLPASGQLVLSFPTGQYAALQVQRASLFNYFQQ